MKRKEESSWHKFHL